MGITKVITEICNKAVVADDVAVLNFAHENGCACTAKTANIAAEHAAMKCLKYIFKNNCHWDRYTICKAAAKSGSYECMKFVHYWGEGVLNSDVMDEACKTSVELIKYLIEYRCLPTTQGFQNMMTCDDALVKLKLLYFWQRDHSDTMKAAVSNDRLDCMEYLYGQFQNSRLFDGCADIAVSRGNVQCLKFIVENGGKITSQAIINSFDGPCFDYFCTRDLSPFKEVLDYAARHNFEAFKKIITAGGKYDEATMTAAATSGNEVIVLYLIELKCPHDINATNAAAASGNLLLFKLVLKNDFPRNKDTIAAAKGECAEYIALLGSLFTK